MIKYKSFEVKETEALNKFVESHEPLMSKENNDNGITLHNGYFIVRYEDGKFNDKSVGVSNTRQALNTYRNNVVVKTIEAQAIEGEMHNMFPKEDVNELIKKPLTWFRDYYVAKGLTNEQANTLGQKVLKSLQDRNLAEFEIKRTEEVNIPILEAILKSFE